MVRRSKKRKKIMKLLFVGIILFILASLIFLIPRMKLSHKNFVEMRVIDVDYINHTAKIILKSNCYKLVFYTSKEQGKNIEIALKNLKTERPLTHDLIISIFNKFNLNLKELRITKLEDGTYYSNLVFGDFFSYTFIDSRPSDGVAIALRANKPILVNKDLAENTCLENIL